MLLGAVGWTVLVAPDQVTSAGVWNRARYAFGARVTLITRRSNPALSAPLLDAIELLAR